MGVISPDNATSLGGQAFGDSRLLIIQHLWRRWDAPAGQAPLPGPQDVEWPEIRIPGWGQVFDCSGDDVRYSQMRLDPRYAEREWAPLTWRGSAAAVEIGLARPDRIRSPWETWHVPDWLFTLKAGQIGQVRWNGRFSARGGIGPCFEDHVYWIGVGDPEPGLFRDRPLSASYERLNLRAST
jgi:hypothetical protein